MGSCNCCGKCCNRKIDKITIEYFNVETPEEKIIQEYPIGGSLLSLKSIPIHFGDTASCYRYKKVNGAIDGLEKSSFKDYLLYITIPDGDPNDFKVFNKKFLLANYSGKTAAFYCEDERYLNKLGEYLFYKENHIIINIETSFLVEDLYVDYYVSQGNDDYIKDFIFTDDELASRMELGLRSLSHLYPELSNVEVAVLTKPINHSSGDIIGPSLYSDYTYTSKKKNDSFIPNSGSPSYNSAGAGYICNSIFYSAETAPVFGTQIQSAMHGIYINITCDNISIRDRFLTDSNYFKSYVLAGATLKEIRTAGAFLAPITGDPRFNLICNNITIAYGSDFHYQRVRCDESTVRQQCVTTSGVRTDGVIDCLTFDYPTGEREYHCMRQCDYTYTKSQSVVFSGEDVFNRYFNYNEYRDDPRNSFQKYKTIEYSDLSYYSDVSPNNVFNTLDFFNKRNQPIKNYEYDCCGSGDDNIAVYSYIYEFCGSGIKPFIEFQTPSLIYSRYLEDYPNLIDICGSSYGYDNKKYQLNLKIHYSQDISSKCKTRVPHDLIKNRINSDFKIGGFEYSIKRINEDYRDLTKRYYKILLDPNLITEDTFIYNTGRTTSLIEHRLPFRNSRLEIFNISDRRKNTSTQKQDEINKFLKWDLPTGTFNFPDNVFIKKHFQITNKTSYKTPITLFDAGLPFYNLGSWMYGFFFFDFYLLEKGNEIYFKIFSSFMRAPANFSSKLGILSAYNSGDLLSGRDKNEDIMNLYGINSFYQSDLVKITNKEDMYNPINLYHPTNRSDYNTFVILENIEDAGF